MKRLPLDHIKEGMILAKSAESPNRELLFNAGHILSHEDLLHLAKKEVFAVWIKESEDLSTYEQLSDANRKNVDSMLQAIFRFNKDSRHPLMHFMLAYRREELARELQQRSKL